MGACSGGCRRQRTGRSAILLQPARIPGSGRPPPLLGLVLLLPLLLPPCVHSSEVSPKGPGKVVVLAPTELHGRLDDILTLTCHLQHLESKTPRVTQITWKRLDPSADPSIVAEFHWERGPSIREPDRMEFAAAHLGGDLLDASLIVRKLSPRDEANYTCEIQVAVDQIGRAQTWLRVFYAPQVSISLYEDIGQQGHRETSLTCDARSNPEPKSYNWSTTTGPLPPSAVPQGSRLLIQPTEESIKTTFICRVSNDLGTGLAVMTVLLPGSPQEPSPSPSPSHLALLIILPIVGILLFVAVVVGVLLYFKPWRQFRQNHHSAPDHGADSCAAVQREASASQEPPSENTEGLRERPGDTGAGPAEVRTGC